MRTRLVSVLVALVIAGSAGCGGDDDDDEPAAGGSTTTTREERRDGGDGDGVDPVRWTRGVCTELGTWQDELERLGTQLGTDLETVSDPAEARDGLVQFIDDAVEATTELIEAVDELGVPDVDQGDEIAEDIGDGLSEVRQVFVDGRNRAQNLPINDPAAFQAGAEELGADLTEAGEEIQADFEALDAEYDVPELDRAFDEEEACQGITG